MSHWATCHWEESAVERELPFRIVLGVEFGLIFALRAYYLRMAYQESRRSRWLESRWQVAGQAILGVCAILSLLLYLAYPPAVAWAALPLPDAVRWLGAALGLVSFPLLWWTHVALGRNFSTVLHLRAEHTLVTSGPYRWVRHPMYSVIFLGLLGFVLLAANGLLAVLWVGGLTAIIARRLPHEEAAMREKFGEEYRAYAARTGRFFPRLALRR
jgi:protein-S-isoprenylcysteine O-methyltransferase Ste14